MSEPVVVSTNGQVTMEMNDQTDPRWPYGAPGTYDVHFEKDPAHEGLWTEGTAKVVTGLGKRQKIGLVGFSEASKLALPWLDEEWALCSLNQHMRHMPRASYWFEIHTREQYLSDTVPGTDYLKWLQTTPLPIYVTELYPDMPTAMKWPSDAILDLGAHVWEEKRGQFVRRDYNQSSLSAMLGWALVEGFDTIGIWGVDLIVGTEYCVAPGTRVLTAGLQWVEVAKVAEGDTLAAFDETAPTRGGRRWREAVVQRTTRLRRPCYRLTLDDGTTVVSSAEHRWLVQSDGVGWRTTEQMARSIGHRNSNIRLIRLADVWEEDRSWEAGYLAAAFDGEGAIGPRSLAYSQRENAMSRTVQAALAALGFRASIIAPAGSDCLTHSLRGGRPEMLRFLGQVRPRRLLDRFAVNRLGRIHATAHPRVMAVEFIGEQDVIGLGTSTGTFVAEGLASHNSYQKPNMEWLLGFAQGQGYTVTRGTKPRGVGREIFIPETSALLHQNYSYGPQTAADNPLRAPMVDRQQVIARGQKDLVDTLNKIDGELHANLQWITLLEGLLAGKTVKWETAGQPAREISGDPAIMLELLRERQQQCLKAKGEFLEQFQQAEGAFEALAVWLTYLEWQDRGARPKYKYLDGREEFIKPPR